MKIAGMVVLAALSGWFVRGIRFERAPDPPPAPRPVRALVQSEPIADPVPVLRQVPLDAASLGERNLFAYRTDGPLVIVAPPIEEPVPVAAPTAVIVPEPPAPQPIPFPHHYIGTFGSARNRVAAFKRDGDIVTIREGERVGDFVLRSIGRESVEVEGADGIRRIPLSGDL